MIQTLTLDRGLTLRCFRDSRFKHGCLSLQFLAPMCSETAAMNALIPAVLLRGTTKHPDLRAITQHLDMLYGSAVSPMARRVGNIQAAGLYCAFMDDRFAMEGDQVLASVIDFLGELLLDSPLTDGGFRPDFVELEKKNQISAVESEGNDKRHYSLNRTVAALCKGDPYGLPRLGTVESISAITPQSLRAQYEQLLLHSPIDIFYVGSRSAEEIAEMVKPIFAKLSRDAAELPAQTGLSDWGTDNITETQEVSQGKLCMSYVTPVTVRDKDFAAMQVMNVIFGGGMTSKLFMNVREKQSLCYSISSGYYSAKGIVMVSAGIDFDKEAQTREEVARQLQACCDGDITEAELTAAKESLISGLQGAHDSPSAIEGYYQVAFLSGAPRTTAEHAEAVRKVTREDVAAMARSLQPGVTYFLKGGQA